MHKLGSADAVLFVLTIFFLDVHRLPCDIPILIFQANLSAPVIVTATEGPVKQQQPLVVHIVNV